MNILIVATILGLTIASFLNAAAFGEKFATRDDWPKVSWRFVAFFVLDVAGIVLLTTILVAPGPL